MTDKKGPLERAPRDGGEVEAALIECAHLWRRILSAAVYRANLLHLALAEATQSA